MSENNHYVVSWTIDIWADNPKEAAAKAREVQLDAQSTATFFTVADPETNQRQTFDLLEDERPLTEETATVGRRVRCINGYGWCDFEAGKSYVITHDWGGGVDMAPAEGGEENAVASEFYADFVLLPTNEE